MTTYYLSSKSGSDSNNGTSATQAWSSFSKLSGKLKAGDTVLLEKGSDFDQTLTFSKVSGTAEMPITISSYGAGDAPILSADNGKGITSSNSNYFIVENITIQSTGDVGIYGWNSNNWIVRNVTIDNAGGIAHNGSVNWTRSSNIMFENATVTNSHGDGIYMTLVNNVAVIDSAFKNVTGQNADNIQISGTNALLAGNIMVIDPSSDTTKGNVVFQGENLYLHDNYMEGGSFGASVSADNVVLENNVIKDHTKYSWSSNVMITDQVTGDVADNITIKDNNFYNANKDINIDGKNTTAATMTVKNLEISGNEFHDWLQAPLALNGVNAKGVFENNVSFEQGNLVYATSSNTSGLVSSNNTYATDTNTDSKVIAAPVAPALEPKIITIKASGSMFDGAPILKLLLNGTVIAEQEVTALKANGQIQVVTFEVATFNKGDTFSIQFANDKFNVATGQDRDLYVHSVSIDGASLNLKDADISGKLFYLKKEGGAMFYSSNATATFSSDDVPEYILTKPVAAITVADSHFPRLEDILSNDEHNIFYDGENHHVGVSGNNTFGAGFADLTSALSDLQNVMATNIT